MEKTLRFRRLDASRVVRQRRTARFGMGILLTKARSPSLSFGDYARNNLANARSTPEAYYARNNLNKSSLCSAPRRTARFGMRMPFANARSPSLSFGDYARNNLANARSATEAYFARNNLANARSP